MPLRTAILVKIIGFLILNAEIDLRMNADCANKCEGNEQVKIKSAAFERKCQKNN